MNRAWACHREALGGSIENKIHGDSGVHLLATMAKCFLHLKKTDLQRLELGLIIQFLMAIWVAFAKKTLDSFVLLMRFS